MKICIIDFLGNRHELLLNNNEPKLDKINDEILLLENYEYKIIIHDKDRTENLELFIGDYCVPLHYNSTTDCYETAKERLFFGCFDLVNISVVYELDGNEQILYSEYTRVATTKQTAKQVELMLDEIENSIPNSLETCFSKNHKQSGLNKNNNIRSIWNTLTIVDEIVSIYDKNYSYFLNHRKTSIEKNPVITDVRSMKEIDQDSLRWIVCNPDYLERTRTNTGIIVNGDFYIPSKVKTYKNNHSYDVYENRIILGFISTVLIYVESQLDGFRNELSELSSIPDKIVKQLPNTHELTGRCIYIYYKGIMDRFIERKEQLQELLFKYERALNCNYEIINAIPKLTNTFKEVYQYRVCYEAIVKWLEFGDYNFSHIDYLFKLKTLTRIFEYYCLIKLQSAISMLGYSLQETDRISYGVEKDDESNINNSYRFTGNGYELTLLYEPVIWTNRTNETINLFSTGYNFSKALFNNYWTPDFVVKIVSERGEYYFILDSKYSPFTNVKKTLFPELVLKYSAQIASMNKHWSDVIGIGALYPDTKDNIFYFKKNEISSEKEPLPQYFAISVVGETTGTELLKNRISDVFNVINSIENNTLNINRIKSSTKSDNHNGSISVKPLEQSNADEINSSDNTHADKKRGVCKRCLYYGKSRCLFKGKITHSENTCENYAHRNNSNFISDNSCRNMIQISRNGRIKYECKVSGSASCVGAEHCKYFQKKKER